MAKKALLTIDSTYCKVKKGLLTADGVYNKVKKAFITIGGVYRPCWSGGKLVYWGTATSLYRSVYNLSAASVGNYALFGGGTGVYSNLVQEMPYVNAYDKSLTHSRPTSMSIPKAYQSSTTIGNHALFGGGMGSTGLSSTSTSTMTDVVDAYDTSLTRTTPTKLSTARYYMAAASLGSYALFVGGYATIGTSTIAVAVVDAYDTSLTRTTPTELSTARYRLAAASVGNYALFGGGTGSGASNIVDVYDKALTRTTAANLSVGRYGLSATRVGKYALFCGGGYRKSGSYSTTYAATVDAYDESLTQTIPTELSIARMDIAATTLEGYSLFGGGESFGIVGSAALDAYDESLTCTNPGDMSVERTGLAAASIGSFALFGGGRQSTSSSSPGTEGYVNVYAVD